MKNKVLISTIQPVSGGVPRMLCFVLECLRQKNYEVTIAYYEPYSVSPDLSVPLYKTLFSKPDVKFGDEFAGTPCVGVGCWLPEMEFTHYWKSKRWERLINEHDIHLSVSGSCLAALHYVQTKTPFLAWAASDWSGDREHRVQKFPILRRLLDYFVVRPIALKMERNIIESQNIIALSNYTRRQLNKIGGTNAIQNILYTPVDVEKFQPKVKKKSSNRIGFIGRFEDPRKNIQLLLKAGEYVKKQSQILELVLIGDKLSNSTKKLITKLGLDRNIYHQAYVIEDELPLLLNTLDLFVVPSYQEGLCIAALEAMSCGVPVISTCCGGPESYIEHQKNGLLTSFEPIEMGQAILSLLSNNELRERYSLAARQVIIDKFSRSALEQHFWKLFKQTFNNQLQEI